MRDLQRAVARRRFDREHRPTPTWLLAVHVAIAWLYGIDWISWVVVGLALAFFLATILQAPELPW